VINEVEGMSKGAVVAQFEALSYSCLQEMSNIASNLNEDRRSWADIGTLNVWNTNQNSHPLLRC
jgi:hypothetical protein